MVSRGLGSFQEQRCINFRPGILAAGIPSKEPLPRQIQRRAVIEDGTQAQQQGKIPRPRQASRLQPGRPAPPG